MEFDNLSFNWRSTDDEYAASKNELEILNASGSLLGTLTCRTQFFVNTNRVSFNYNVAGEPTFARAEALDTFHWYWLLSVEDGTLTKIPPSSLGVYIMPANYQSNGFEYRRRSHRDGAKVDFRFDSIANLFEECNRLRGKWDLTLSAPDLPDFQLTDLDTQLALLEFAEPMELRNNIVIPSTVWDYEDEGECGAAMHVVFEGQ